MQRKETMEINQTELLTERENKILRLRVGIDKPIYNDSVAKEAYDVIGRELGLSRERIRQIQHEALAKLGIKYPENWPSWTEIRNAVFLAKADSEF